MKFLDVAKVYAASGSGGNGCMERRPGKVGAGEAREPVFRSAARQ
jgi:GTPase involved in cell partitioning and DNA repair